MSRLIHVFAVQMLIVLQFIPIMSTMLDLFLFRRKKQNESSRDQAFQNLFAATASVFGSAAGMKSTWMEQWNARAERDLPEKYSIGDEIITDAAHDLRFAVSLLQRNRWKSVVQPLFETVDELAWQRFQDTASGISTMLIGLIDTYADALKADEQDWITAAVEEFDEASRRRRAAERNGTSLDRRVAEGTYQPVYIAIQLSDRLIERRRNELLEE